MWEVTGKLNIYILQQGMDLTKTQKGFFLIKLLCIHYSNAVKNPDDAEYNTNFEIQYEMTLKSKLRIKNEYLRNAHKKLSQVDKHQKRILSKKLQQNIKTNVGKSAEIDSKITYVGVHNRRSDHIKFMRDLENREPLEVNYFDFAFQYFRYIFRILVLSIIILRIHL